MAKLKVYANRDYYYRLEDQSLLTTFKSLFTTGEIFGEEESYKREFSFFCQSVREKLQIQNIISIHLDSDGKTLCVLIYGILASSEVTFKLNRDELGFYIEVDSENIRVI